MKGPCNMSAIESYLTGGKITTEFNYKYHIICYSLLPDCHAGLHRNKKTGFYISFGSVNFDLTDEKIFQDIWVDHLPTIFFLLRRIL